MYKPLISWIQYTVTQRYVIIHTQLTTFHSTNQQQLTAYAVQC